MLKKILVVDDSALMRKVLSDIIMFDERFVISDMAANGFEAFDLVTQNPKKYDVIILDLNMPKMNGIQFLEQINKYNIKASVLIVSTIAKEGAAETIRCLELGAFDFVTKPDNIHDTKEAPFRDRILSALVAATEEKTYTSTSKSEKPVKEESTVPTRNNTVDSVMAARNAVEQMLSKFTNSDRKLTEKISNDVVEKPEKQVEDKKRGSRGVQSRNTLVAIACSTGGPKALHNVIPMIPKNLAAPVLIVQHMPEGFTESLAVRLNEISNISVKEAENGDLIKKGNVYIAKGGCQLRVQKQGKEYGLSVVVEAPRGGLRPCADIMYESLASCDFDTIVCVVLTGMGSDGCLGIQKLKENKNIYVIAQDEATSTVYGMPKVVKEAGLTDEVVGISEVAEAITRKVGVH